MKNQIITAFEKKHFQDTKQLPEFRAGDTVVVSYRVKDGEKVRVQPFEGIVIRRKRGTADGSFTVRKIGANGIGVERVFPLYSQNIADLQVKARGIVRRSRLYYLRELTGKAARIRSKFGAALMAADTTANDSAEEVVAKKPASKPKK